MKTTSVLRRIFKDNTFSGTLSAKSSVVKDTQQMLLIKQGHDQFKKLVDYGLTVPVGLL